MLHQESGWVLVSKMYCRCHSCVICACTVASSFKGCRQVIMCAGDSLGAYHGQSRLKDCSAVIWVIKTKRHPETPQGVWQLSHRAQLDCHDVQARHQNAVLCYRKGVRTERLRSPLTYIHMLHSSHTVLPAAYCRARTHPQLCHSCFAGVGMLSDSWSSDALQCNVHMLVPPQ